MKYAIWLGCRFWQDILNIYGYNFMTKQIELDVFGKHVLAKRTNEGWSMFYLSDDGKRRPALDILVPEFVSESEIENFLEDICHEWATEKNNSVLRLK